MVSEKLLATYSLLSFINNESEEKRKSITLLFLPLVQEAINRMLYSQKHGKIMGKSYLEIKDKIKDYFDLEMPPAVLQTILLELSKGHEEKFQLNNDLSYIIKSGFADSVENCYREQQEKIKKLENHYRHFCERENVNFDFEELVSFIQDQKNRIFSSSPTEITNQDYYVSKYVAERIKSKDKYYQTIGSIFLGGIMSSYLSFQITEKIMDVELLFDTNFYISLCNLNTEDSYVTCQQVFEITKRLGFHFSILQRTIDQIIILLNNRILHFSDRDAKAAWDEADIHAACIRRNLSQNDLALYKDSILKDLEEKGIRVIYDTNIPAIVQRAQKSEDFRKLKHKRNNDESALNDIIAQFYVQYRRENKPIVEFSDVNCWFLTNSISFSSHNIEKPLYERTNINASDLLVLLWYANPSLKIGNASNLLTLTSMSANVLCYRSEKQPTDKTIELLQNKIAGLQYSKLIDQNAVAKLCVRMSEGCVDENEANRLLMMTTTDLVQYMNKIDNVEQAYMEKVEENDNLQTIITGQNIQNADLKLTIMRILSLLYVVGVFACYYLPTLLSNYFSLKTTASFCMYGIITIISILLLKIKDNYVLLGLKSFFKKDEVKRYIIETEKNNTGISEK